MSRSATDSRADVDIPGSADQITPEWLTPVLRRAGHDVEVGELSISNIGAGVGMLGSVLRVEPKYVRGDGPGAVVVKLPTPVPHNRQVAIAFNNYRREVHFYQKAAGQTAMRTPHVYLAEIAGDADFVLVMEDLSDWIPGDQVEGCTPDQARHCMTALAQLHASFWSRVDEGNLDWIPDSYPSVMSEGLQQGTMALYDPFLALFEADVPRPLRDMKRRFIEALPQLQQWMNLPPRTIIQGDFRMDNLFFGRRPEHSPVACCDWQASLRGKGIHDVAYLLSGSVPVTDRRASERALLALWLQGLAAGGVEGYTPEQAWHDYRRAVLYLWSYVVVIAGGLDPDNTRSRAWLTQMVRRSATALLDLDCLELLDEFQAP